MTDEELETIREESRRIDFGKITVNITGEPHNIVDIVPEKIIRYVRHKRAVPVTPKAQDKRGSGRYGD